MIGNRSPELSSLIATTSSHELGIPRRLGAGLNDNVVESIEKGYEMVAAQAYRNLRVDRLGIAYGVGYVPAYSVCGGSDTIKNGVRSTYA